MADTSTQTADAGSLGRVAVIGRGLIGSAAARHLAKAGHDVVLIGPDEPADRNAHDGVFASHYDEGRITRALDPDPFWSEVSRASLARYAEIEAESGIPFFSEVGALMTGPAGDAFLTDIAAIRDAADIPCTYLDETGLRNAFPYFGFPGGTAGFHEPSNAGHISPRNLVRAQTTAACRAGARLVPDIATRLSSGVGGVSIQTDSTTIEADHVLVAAGGFTNMLFDPPLPLTVFARTIAYFELDEAEAARLASMPSLIWKPDREWGPYLLPPIRYPDGRVYLKIGGDPSDRIIGTADEAKAWFRTDGSADVGAHLEDLTRQIIPGLRIAAMHTAPCIMTYAEGDYPVIARVDDRICVATAGNGRGAKNSDELGRRGAALLAGDDTAATRTLNPGRDKT